jgi:histidyl-tRNA synthetase
MMLFEMVPQAGGLNSEEVDSAFVERTLNQDKIEVFAEQDAARSRLAISNKATINHLRSWFHDSAKEAEALDELEHLSELVLASGYGSKRIRIDPSVVRGLEYYTGPVFEAELTAPIKDERGQAIRLGSVVSGGRYDGLVERFTGEKVPATGVSIGVSRLLYGLKTLGKIPAETVQGPVVVLVLDRDRIADYQKMAQALRNAGIRAELYLGESGMKAQMKYADKRGSSCVVIQGGDEKARGEVQIKDLVLGATLTSIKDRDDYLKKQAEAQFAVPQEKLVEAVRGVLARHKG